MLCALAASCTAACSSTNTNPAQSPETQSLAEFDARFRGGALPESMPEVSIATAGAGIAIANLAKLAAVVDSTSDALRLIVQRGLRVDGEVVADKARVVPPGTTVVIQAGKRKFARVTVN